MNLYSSHTTKVFSPPGPNCRKLSYIVCFQLKRLRECEKMIVALELAGWLNESNLALQGVVQCYGLVAPLIFYKIPSIPVFQVCKLS